MELRIYKKESFFKNQDFYVLPRNEGIMSLDCQSQFVRHKICDVKNGNYSTS